NLGWLARLDRASHYLADDVGSFLKCRSPHLLGQENRVGVDVVNQHRGTVATLQDEALLALEAPASVQSIVGVDGFVDLEKAVEHALLGMNAYIQVSFHFAILPADPLFAWCRQTARAAVCKCLKFRRAATSELDYRVPPRQAARGLEHNPCPSAR